MAIGDSYTVGEGVGKNETWPNLLTLDLQKNGVDIQLVANVARTGWLTQHVLELEVPLITNYSPTFATLLIGVNDWVQEIEISIFAANFAKIIDRVQKILPDPLKMIILTIPDFSVTHIGEIFGAGRDIKLGLLEFNQIIKNEAETRHLPVVDIFPLSQGMGNDPELVGSDGLHPSAKEYQLWEEEIFPTALQLLTE